MKGFTEEYLYIIIILLTFIILIVFLNLQLFSNTKEINEQIEEKVVEEDLRSFSYVLFNSKLPIISTTYMESLIDSILQNNGEYVYYGDGVGGIKISSIIVNISKKFIGSPIAIKIAIGRKTKVYGKIKNPPRYIATVLVPVPDERIGKVSIEIGG